MAQTREVRGVATRIETDGKSTVVVYHCTVVVHFDTETVTLNSGGWHTVTTKLRMNQASNQFNLGYQVYQSKHEWFVDHYDAAGDRVRSEFEDGMTIPRTPLRWTGDAWVPAASLH